MSVDALIQKQKMNAESHNASKVKCRVSKAMPCEIPKLEVHALPVEREKSLLSVDQPTNPTCKFYTSKNVFARFY